VDASKDHIDFFAQYVRCVARPPCHLGKLMRMQKHTRRWLAMLGGQGGKLWYLLLQANILTCTCRDGMHAGIWRPWRCPTR
jgi:hypothetical protein